MTNSRAQTNSSTQPDPISLAKVVLRRWGLMASVAGILLAVGAAAITMKVWKPVFEGKQFVRVRVNRDYADVGAKGQSKIDAKSVLAPAKSEYMLQKIANDPAIQKLRVGTDWIKLKKLVRTDSAGGETFAVICRDRDPKFAALVAELLANELIESNEQYRTTSLRKLEDELALEIAKAQTDVDALLTRLKTSVEDRVVADEGKDGQVVDPDGTHYVAMQKSLWDEESLKEQLENSHDRLKQSLDIVASEATGEQSTAQAPADSEFMHQVNAASSIIVIDSQIRELTSQLDALARLGPSHPKVSTINNQILRARQNRDAESTRLIGVFKQTWFSDQKKALASNIAEMGQQVIETDQQIADSETRINRLVIEVKRLADNLRENNDSLFEFNQLEQELSLARSRRDAWKLEHARIHQKDISLSEIILLDPERIPVPVPTVAVEEYPFKILGLACLAAFLLPFAAAFALELRLRRISHSEQIKQHVPFKLLGEVADLPTRSSRPAKLASKKITRQLRLYEESVDNLSAILVHVAENRPLVFSVTSAASNEGKTTLSSQLAISSARSNFGRTLLIDADLRSPSLHRLFDVPIEPGLGDVLSEPISLDEVITQTEIENLDLLTAGKLRSNPRRYFSGNQWADLLKIIKEKYDHVVIDTPPVLAASESLAISKECDHTLMCVLRDVSRADSVKRAYERLIAADVNVVGYAFGGVPQMEYAIKYGSYEYNMS